MPAPKHEAEVPKQNYLLTGIQKQQVKGQNTELLQQKPVFSQVDRCTCAPSVCMHVFIMLSHPFELLHNGLQTCHCISSWMRFGGNSTHWQHPLISVKGLLSSSLLCRPETPLTPAFVLFSSISFPLNRIVITFVTLPDKTPTERLPAASPVSRLQSPPPTAVDRHDRWLRVTVRSCLICVCALITALQL